MNLDIQEIRLHELADVLAWTARHVMLELQEQTLQMSLSLLARRNHEYCAALLASRHDTGLLEVQLVAPEPPASAEVQQKMLSRLLHKLQSNPQRHCRLHLYPQSPATASLWDASLWKPFAPATDMSTPESIFAEPHHD